MYSARVLAFLAVLVGAAQSFPWDIVVGGEQRLEFYYNGTVTHVEDIPSAHYITALTYDPVHFRVLFADFHYPNKSIYSFDTTTKKIQTLVMKQTGASARLAYDPLTQLLFWTEYNKIYSLSLKPASSNEAVDEFFLVTSEYHCEAIAVDSCGGYVYWSTDYKIERVAFDGSEREVLIDANVSWRTSLIIDQQTEKMYWIERNASSYQYSIESANLNGKNRKTIYIIGSKYNAAALTVSKDFIYWRSDNQRAILQFPKHQQHNVAPVVYSQYYSLTYCWSCPLVAANYTFEEQTMGIKSCEALKSLIPDLEERHGSICHNYCLRGNCSVSAEGHPKCSCEAGYFGERCEVNACYMYCLNNGVCSLNEAGKSVCKCTAEYEGKRCDVSICKDYCMQGNCSVSTDGQRTCSCDRGYSGERCDVSICKDYCMQGNCSVSTEGQRTCRCDAGYSGERCEVNACHSYCLNNGDCSLNEEDEPVCQCTAGYEGERCHVATTHTGACVCADNMTQQMLLDLRSEVKQVREDLQCTLQLYTDKLDEKEAKLQICEESRNDDQ